MTDAADVRNVPRSTSRSRLFNPYLLIFVGALLDSTGEVLLKMGADAVAGGPHTSGPVGFAAPLFSGWTWIGIVSYVSSLLTWLCVLRTVPLSIAFPLINVVHVLVPTGAHLFLHEVIPIRLVARRWIDHRRRISRRAAAHGGRGEIVKPRTIILAVVCQLFLVAGQLYFKRAMRDRPQPLSRSSLIASLGIGILAQSIWFFIWINLLEAEKLSRIFPFEGLNPVLIVAAAWFLLKERLNWSTAAGRPRSAAGSSLASGS